MMEESGDKGLIFRAGIKESIKADPLGVMHNSYKGAFAKLRSRPRNIPAMIEANKDQFHASAWQRKQVSPIAYPAYHPTEILKTDGEIHVDIFANTRWNATNVYLEAGKSYLFSATGTWQDSKDICDWRGTEDGHLSVGDIVRGGASLWGISETLFKKISKNDSTDFLLTKRVEEKKWFVMIGAIANDSGPGPNAEAVGKDGSPAPHQYVDLTRHEQTPLKLTESGYLYCFPNDVWSLYDNNRGSIRLTIKCV